jgi:hypothetical protein
MGMSMNCMVTWSLQKQLNQVAIWHNEEEDIIETKLHFFKKVAQFKPRKSKIYFVKNMHDKITPYRVQDIVYNSYGTSRNIY